MEHFHLNSGVTSLSLHEDGMPDVNISLNSFLRKTISSPPIFFYASIGIRSGLQALFPFIIASWFIISSTDIGGTSPAVSADYSRSNYNRANDACVCGNRLIKRLTSPSSKSQVMFASAFS